MEMLLDVRFGYGANYALDHARTERLHVRRRARTRVSCADPVAMERSRRGVDRPVSP